MRAQCICAGVRLAFAGTVGPLTRVPLLSAPDVLVVDVLHQPVHVPQIAGAATVPATYSNLVTALASIIVVLIVTQCTQDIG